MNKNFQFYYLCFISLQKIVSILLIPVTYILSIIPVQETL